MQGEASPACLRGVVRQGPVIPCWTCARPPAGKSATLAQYMENKGDAGFLRRGSKPPDAGRRRAGTAGRGLRPRVLHNDAAVYNEAFAGADAVLCDVPCSGLGVLAKKPDIRQKTLDGLDGLVRLQRAILDSRALCEAGRAARLLTCTLNPDENAGIVRPFLKRASGVSYA